MWEFPAGLIEDGETPEETGKRELFEETGIASIRTKLLGSQTPISGLVGDTFHSVLAEIPEIEPGDLKLQGEEGIVDAKVGNSFASRGAGGEPGDRRWGNSNVSSALLGVQGI